MQSLSRGILIACEGIDGSGKSTLVRNLADALSNKDFPVLVTREPGATPLGVVVRGLLQEKRVPICSKAEYLLFASNRAQHFQEIIIPALQEKKIIISDRMADSSLVYQGFGRGLSLDMLNTINKWSMNNILPDITLYVKITPELSRERIIKRNEALTSFEKEKEAFTQQLVLGFETIFANRPDVLSLDGAQLPDQLTHQALAHVLAWIERQRLIS